jgi:transposase-like protein
MGNKIGDLIKMIHKLPENRVEELAEVVREMIEEDRKTGGSAESRPECPACGAKEILRNGTQNGNQRYKCKACGKVYSARHNSVMWHSHSGEAVWKQVIRDTIAGKSMDETAWELELTHATVFNMRHKVLLAVEDMERQEPTVLGGVCELDETYVLECNKGSTMPEGYWRGPRKHGAKAQKRGLSNEQIAICTGVDRNGNAYARSVNRATPSTEEVKEVFGGRIEAGSLVLTDGARSYRALEKQCECDVEEVMSDGAERHFLHINTANAFHSFIKGRYEGYRGVATKYINRYNSLFSRIFRNGETAADEIYSALCANNRNSFFSIHDVNTRNLLSI